MTFIVGRRFWIVPFCLAALASLGCEMMPTWMPFQEPASDQMEGVVPPAERIAALHELTAEAAKSSPEKRLQISDQLAHSIRSEHDPIIRVEIIRVLGSCPGPTADAVLKAALRDPDAQVRIAACESWGTRGDERAAKLLSDLLRSDIDIDVRLAAAKALGETRNPAAVEALGEALEDSDPAMQYRAVLALEKATGKDLGNDVYRWQQYVRGELSEPEPTLAERLRRLF
ncbi:MAG: HEAT repeat domain-containing protein [Pirellulales bacterium]|nr:HEAT repeat domain-containing protein [Pirellulales bacterium]